jgi:hypothetical protein
MGGDAATRIPVAHTRTAPGPSGQDVTGVPLPSATARS